MREIKFRAWDKYEKRLWSWEQLLHQNYSIRYFFSVPDYLELMQYTGLKDKNGKEIYEGDIVAFDRDGKDYWREIYEIKYSPYRACWQLFLIKRANHTDSPQYISNHFTQGEADTIEVIGNIYESPGLLSLGGIK